jgi:hypothetical protein
VGVNALDRQRVDVAVDLTPCLQAVEVEMVIVSPCDDEVCSIVLAQNLDCMLDKIMHLRQDAQPGEYTLHVGVFFENALVARSAKRFTFPMASAKPENCVEPDDGPTLQQRGECIEGPTLR